jgi:hypothetical protein
MIRAGKASLEADLALIFERLKPDRLPLESTDSTRSSTIRIRSNASLLGNASRGQIS